MKKEIPIFAPWLGVFETLKVINGEIQFFKEHFQSLKESSRVLGLKVPTEKRLLKVKLPLQNGRLRWIVDTQGFRFFFQEEKPNKRSSFVLGVSLVRLGCHNWDARYKTVSYLSHWQARQESENFDEVVLLNEWDQIASVSMGNIFWVKEGIVYTPSVDCGCRSGVVRNWVKKQVRVKEGRFGLDQLGIADEIFITNSMMGVQSVNRFLSRNFKLRKIVRTLQQEWKRTLKI